MNMVDPQLKEFLEKHRRDGVFAIDGVAEILRAPLQSGWTAATTRVQLASSEEYPLDPQVIQLLTPHKERLAGQAWEAKYRVAALGQNIDGISALKTTLAPTTYEEGSGFHRGLRSAVAQGDASALGLRDRLTEQLVQPGSYSVAGIAVVHVIVITPDDRLVLCQRSPHAGYHPLHWSISFEEQINQSDMVFGNFALSMAAIRGFREEFSCDSMVAAEDVRTLGVFLEYGILNIAFCVLLKSPLSFDELYSIWSSRAKKSWENVDVRGLPFTPGNVAALLQSPRLEKDMEGIDGDFHPTSKYRLVLAALHRFGTDAVKDALVPSLRAPFE
jgi:hypothetical protein